MDAPISPQNDGPFRSNCEILGMTDEICSGPFAPGSSGDLHPTGEQESHRSDLGELEWMPFA